MKVGIARLHFPVSALGPGNRCGIWFQGCSIGCAGCVSRDTWPRAADEELVEVAEVLEWVTGHAADIDGVTISGGEPFDQPEALYALLDGLSKLFRGGPKTTLVYSGYSLERLHKRHSNTIQLADAVITGPFVASQPSSHPWFGSSNQELHVLREDVAHQFAHPQHVQTHLQVSADDSQLWIIGIPRRGDLERMEELLRTRGVELENVSWRS